MRALLRATFLTVLVSILYGTDGYAQGAGRTEPPTLADRVGEAQQLLDTYYGDRAQLRQAAVLIGAVLVEDASFAPAYVQLARAILMGGHIVGWEFEGGTRQSARKALERAVELDPDYPESYVLLGHLDAISIRPDAAARHLAKAVELGSSNPWIEHNLGDAAFLTQSYEEADRHYARVVERGKGDTAQQERAYVGALSQQMQIAYRQNDPVRLKRLASEATEAAPAEDAWTWGNAGGLMCRIGFLDVGLEYNMKAVSIMPYGVARYNVAYCLYGKAALFLRNGLNEQARSLLDRAMRINPDVRRIADDFIGTGIESLREPLLRHFASR